MRSIASLSLSFGLVSIPVRLYSASVPSAALRFKWMSPAGARLRQRYVASALPEPFAHGPDPSTDAASEDTAAPSAGTPPTARATAARAVIAAPVATDNEAEAAPPIEAPPAPLPRSAVEQVGDEIGRSDMVKGYEYERGKFVLFTPAELDALRAQRRDSIDIVAFVPDGAIDAIYHDKTYLLAPDRRGERTYALLLRALQRSGRSALARWAWKGRQSVVQVRAARGGLVLHQLLYADEVRSPEQLQLDLPDVGDAELQLALQLIEQGARDAYDPHEFVDEEKQRILHAVQQKIAGRRIVSHAEAPLAPVGTGAEVIDLLAALRASLRAGATARPLPARKPVQRARHKAASAASKVAEPARKRKATR